ncbi:MAG: tRNA(Glu)-specific nuclease WapA precursor [Firmicutes bacterium ADurb.Bin182]|nr:MAG: tRNA(Glu)-specific nuclease WapA precursor [Firmicutes bacterium ADurb.Bin182]
MARYLYEYQRVVLEQDAFGDQKAWNVYGINLISRQVDELTLTYMYNGHADVTALLDSNGNLVATYYYDAFGNILEKTGTVDNNILYGGYQYDEETGLYYLNARMYDPITARFLQEDTYKGQYNDPLSLNLYTYCYNEPLMDLDPSGHIGLSNIIKMFQEMAEALRKKAELIKEKAKNLLDAAGSFVTNLIKNESAKQNQFGIENAKSLADDIGSTFAAIVTGAVAGALIIAGAIMNLGAPGLGSGLVGAGIGLAATEIADFLDDGVYNRSKANISKHLLWGFSQAHYCLSEVSCL